MRRLFGGEAAGAAVSDGGKGPGKRTGHLEKERLLGGPGGWSMVLVWQRICLVHACDPCTGWVHSRYAVDGELRKEQVEEGVGMLGLVSHSLWLPGESGVTRSEQSSS